MSTDAIALANRQQRDASDPAASVFVSASAGSGKTKLLIDRLLRLMLPRVALDGTLLPGTDPGRILCLTFTKAAAAEMAIRLQRTLGNWVTLPDELMDKALRALDAPPGEESRLQARALFARVLDLPGGMRIGTIHAFCQSLLRRFPLEAAINPHFTLMEETDAAIALQDSIESVLGRLSETQLAPLASQANLTGFAALVRNLRQGNRAGTALDLVRTDPDAVLMALLHAFGVKNPKVTDVDPVGKACAGFPDEDHLRATLLQIAAAGPPGCRTRATGMLGWLSDTPQDRRKNWLVWQEGFLTQKGELRKTGLLYKKLVDADANVTALFEKAAERLVAIEDEVRARNLAALTHALLVAAAPMVEGYAAHKGLRGQVEYDDLITRTLGLLGDPGAAWVMYKLDGGIDHLLLDEVQDTSRAQWQIAGGLTEEFFVGEGARQPESGPRTIFAVGDYKQSIYGFQGADPDAFREWRRIFEQRARQAGATWREPSLTVSFRSTAPVLSLVDAVFAQPLAAKGVVEPGATMPGHETARPGQGGRVELWPLVPVEEAGDDANPWSAPSRNATQSSPQQRLADSLARWIRAEILRPPAPGEAPLLPGDVLVLVPRRSGFVRALIRALKSADVPVATLVRTGLADQIAVRDLMALCDALLLPQDDLTLACVLTSPLGGVSDDSLMALAADRGAYSDGLTRSETRSRGTTPLWTALRARHAERPDWHAAWTMLEALFRRVDYATPHALLAEALGQQGGRARLLARLGPEAAEPVDELLSAALRYEESHPPSLQGFLHWLRRSDESVKREPDAAGNAVRVMTAHGSKGLQARLVILPDTVSSPRFDATLLWQNRAAVGSHAPGIDLPLYVPRTDSSTEATRALKEAVNEATTEEYNRLLYVALTRASDRLVVCGWAQKNSLPEESWYARCAAGFEALGAKAEAFTLGWDGDARIIEEACSTGERLALSAPPSLTPPPLPAWMGSAPLWQPILPRVEHALARPLAPSRPDDVALGTLPAARSPLTLAPITPQAAREAAFRRGTLVHALLQYLPDCRDRDWTALGHRWLVREGNGLDDAEAARLVARVIAVMDTPALAPLFAPGSRAEQRVTGIAGGSVIVGQVDRMRVLPDEVLICDFKTNRNPPDSVEKTPVLYLRQMAAYRALLSQIYPGRRVTCSLVWTERPEVTVLPDALLDRHSPDALAAATSDGDAAGA